MLSKRNKRQLLDLLHRFNLETPVQANLNRVRRLRNRVQYRSRIADVPDVEIERPKNVLVLTLDCLRNDHLSRTGYDRETTPFLDELSEYTPSISAAPWTFSSVPSILTGRYPHNHGAVYPDDSMRNQDLENPPFGVSDDTFTLAELLASAGYETRFVTAIGTAELPVQGRFKSSVRMHDARAEAVLDDLLDWWNGTAAPKFGYVQLGDLHQPLEPPEEQYFGGIPDLDGVERWRFETDVEPEAAFQEYRAARIKLYDSILRYVDEHIRATVEALAEREDTIVVVTGDHGDEFWEYRELESEHFEDPRGNAGVGHGHALVPPVLEVPVISDSIPIAETDGLASTTDIVPSILTALEAAYHQDFDGVPLQDDGYVRPVLSQEIAYGPNQMSVTHDGDHLIYVPEADTELLLEYETGELVEDRETVRELKQHLPDETASGSAVDLSPEVQRQLQDLGYAE